MTPQSQDFKAKMKVSNPLNDIAANLGVTPKVLTQLATGEDKEFRELVRGIFSILPEDEVAIVAADTGINAQFLDYLSRLFEGNERIQILILNNPSSSKETKQRILDQLSEKQLLSVARNPDTPTGVLECISEHFPNSVDILATLLANVSTPLELKEYIQTLPVSEEGGAKEEETILDLDPSLAISSHAVSQEIFSISEMNAKITLCVDKLYEINVDIVTEFIKKARIEILKRLDLIAKVNHCVLRTIVKNPSLTIEDLDNIDLEMFASLLKKLPAEVGEDVVLELINQAKAKKKQS